MSLLLFPYCSYSFLPKVRGVRKEGLRSAKNWDRWWRDVTNAKRGIIKEADIHAITVEAAMDTGWEDMAL